MIGIFQQQSQAAGSAEASGRLLSHLLAHCLCRHRHTITGLLHTTGQADRDWTGAYRLYRENLQRSDLFAPLRQAICESLDPQAPLVVAVDDSTMPQTGQSIPGAGWHRHPLSPPFHTNLLYGHKFIQLSAALPHPNHPKRARLIPIDAQLIPKVPKPPKKNPSAKQLEEHLQLKAYHAPSAHALRMIRTLRQQLDQSPQGGQRELWICGDSHYSTSTLLPHLPPRCLYVGRIRGDTHLCALPPTPTGPGRPPAYGQKLPTPEELRKDATQPWQTLPLEKNGVSMKIRYKHLAQAKWAAAGAQRVVQVVVVAPFRYRRKNNGPWRYTQPAYLLCTDPHLSVARLLQVYLWRWDIEVNFKELKQLFGLGQAQVRHAQSVTNAPLVCIAAYAGLLWAGLQTFGFEARPLSVQAPKWYPTKKRRRPTTGDLLLQLRDEATARSLGLAHFSDFSLPPARTVKSSKLSQPYSPAPISRAA